MYFFDFSFKYIQNTIIICFSWLISVFDWTFRDIRSLFQILKLIEVSQYLIYFLHTF